MHLDGMKPNINHSPSRSPVTYCCGITTSTGTSEQARSPHPVACSFSLWGGISHLSQMTLFPNVTLLGSHHGFCVAAALPHEALGMS